MILGNSLASLPDSVSNLVKLKMLDVSKNRLSTLPDLSGTANCRVVSQSFILTASSCLRRNPMNKSSLGLKIIRSHTHRS